MTADQRFSDPQPRIHPTAELKSCRLGRYSAIGERVVLREVSVGDYTYFERHAEAIYTEIGKFCSIAANSRQTYWLSYWLIKFQSVYFW